MIVELLVERSRLILTGIFVAFISSLLYRITPTGFLSAGKYRTKEGAVLIYLSAAFILGLLTPWIYEISGFIIKYVSLSTIIGILIICANFIINQSVPTWKHTSPKTLLIYFLGAVLVIIGCLVDFKILI